MFILILEILLTVTITASIVTFLLHQFGMLKEKLFNIAVITCAGSFVFITGLLMIFGD